MADEMVLQQIVGSLNKQAEHIEKLANSMASQSVSVARLETKLENLDTYMVDHKDRHKTIDDNVVTLAKGVGENKINITRIISWGGGAVGILSVLWIVMLILGRTN